MVRANGNVDPQPWCQGFYTGITLNLDGWAAMLDLGNVHHGLLLPILA
jgi:uncharacterized protein